jgi:hypothetical protein
MLRSHRDESQLDLAQLKIQWQAEAAREMYLELIEGANRNHLRQAPTAMQAVENMLALALQAAKKREPKRRQSEGGA